MQDIRFVTGMFDNPRNPADIRRSRQSLLELIEALVRVNQRWLKSYPGTPRLYRSGVVYQPEKTEHWRDIPTVLKAGFGDCEDLAAWRIAELRHSGQQAWPHIRWRRNRKGQTIYHALVKRGDGRTEDPSRALGMGRHPIVNRPVFIHGATMPEPTHLFGRNGTEVLLGACQGLTYSPIMGAWYSKALKSAKAVYAKVPWVKVHAVAKIAGPVVAIAYPPAAPAVAGALALTYAAAKNDPKAILAKQNIDRAAAAGVPAAKEALEVMAVAQAIKKNQAANVMIAAAKAGDIKTRAQIAMLKQAEAMNPAAASAANAIRSAMLGQTPAYQAKIQSAVAMAKVMYPPGVPYAPYAAKSAYQRGL